MTKCPRRRYRAYRQSRRDRPAATTRDYALERVCYHSRPKNARLARSRGRARYALTRLGLVRPHDRTVVHHRNGNAMDNRLANLVVLTPGAHHRLHRARASRLRK